MQMNANQLTKIPVEKLSDTLQFLIAENEIPLSDALKQVIDDVDAVCKKLLRDEPAPAQPVIPEGLLQAINRLLDNDGSRGRFSAIQSYDAREDLERLLASTALPVIPEQPKTELVDLSQQVEILNRILNWIVKELPVPTQKASAMAIRLISVIGIISDLEVSAQAQPVSEPWISVADRQPAEFGRYLCYVEEQNDLGKSHYQWNCSWNGDAFSDSSLTGRVTHWMSLPEAPAQEQK